MKTKQLPVNPTMGSKRSQTEEHDIQQCLTVSKRCEYLAHADNNKATWAIFPKETNTVVYCPIICIILFLLKYTDDKEVKKLRNEN